LIKICVPDVLCVQEIALQMPLQEQKKNHISSIRINAQHAGSVMTVVNLVQLKKDRKKL